MKPMRSFLILFVSLALAAGLSAQTITGYGVTKTHYVVQTSSSAPVDDANPYELSSYVFGSLLAGTYNFTTPGGSAPSPQALSFNSSSAEFQSGSYASTGLLNAAYAEGVYGMTFTNNSGAGPQSASLLDLSGDLYPTYAVATVGGIWAGNRLQVDNTGNYTLTFNFSSMTSDDSISINIKNSGDVSVYSNFANFGSNTNTFVVNSGTLASGQTYYAELRFNNNFITYDTPFTGANGNASFTTSNNFEIQAIPEPSTYAVILGVVGLGGVMVRRCCLRA